MYKTGGTPYHVVENKAKTDPGLYVSAADLNEIRRKLITSLSEKRGEAPLRKGSSIPPVPKAVSAVTDPKFIFQITTEEQMSAELAELHPACIYIPLELIMEYPEKMKLFQDREIVPVAVLPRIITDNQVQDIRDKLIKVREAGIREVLTGNLGQICYARSLGFDVRGDFGLNIFNSYSVEVLKDAGLLSATASFELRIAQIRDMQKSLDTEMIVYGRLPLMVSDQCIIKESAGRCACQTPGQLEDRMGSVFQVVREYGCRNVIYNAHKLYLADKKEDLFSAGLWGLRLLFTTESARECVDLGLSNYKPNVLTRGLYYRGVD